LLFFKKKVILTDIDGVMLDWEEGFSVWMEHHGYKPVDGYKLLYSIGDRYGITKDEGHKLVRLFNESAAIGFLPPVRDAQQYVRLLAEKHKYKFLAVTSLSKDVYARELRIRNLIEDKPENADAGIRCGFKTLLVEHGHNLDYKGPATVVKTWEEIYNIITK